MNKEIIIRKADGVTNRDAAALVQRAMRFDSEIYIEQGSKRINCKSIMGVLSLGLKKGSTITLMAHGDDQEDAIYDLNRLIDHDFLL